MSLRLCWGQLRLPAVFDHDFGFVDGCPFLSKDSCEPAHQSFLTSPYRVARPIARLCVKNATTRKLSDRNAGRLRGRPPAPKRFLPCFSLILVVGGDFALLLVLNLFLVVNGGGTMAPRSVRVFSDNRGLNRMKTMTEGVQLDGIGLVPRCRAGRLKSVLTVRFRLLFARSSPAPKELGEFEQAGCSTLVWGIQAEDELGVISPTEPAQYQWQDNSCNGSGRHESGDVLNSQDVV